MTTGKRQIPIDHQGAGRVRSGDHADGTSSKVSSGGPHGRHETSASSAEKATGRDLSAERDALVKERDALVTERDALSAERDALAAQVEALTDSRLRLQADFENFRKRAARESVDSYVRTQCEVLSGFLPILDNLERALDAAEHHEEGKVLTGVRMTRDMFVDLLKRAGVEEIEGVGAPFDPEVHDAVAVQPSEHEEGVVAAVLERGYRQGDRVLRPARVVVSAGRDGSGSTVDTATPAGAAGPAGGTV